MLKHASDFTRNLINNSQAGHAELPDAALFRPPTPLHPSPAVAPATPLMQSAPASFPAYEPLVPEEELLVPVDDADQVR